MSVQMEPTGALATPKRRKFFSRLIRERKMALVGLIIMGTLVFLGTFGPMLARYPADRASGGLSQAPSTAHWLGTDDAGKDRVSMILTGIRTSMIVGIAGGLVSIVIGGTAGILAGYLGGKTDAAVMRTADFFLVVPEVVLALVLISIFEPGMGVIIIVIGLLLWAGNARVLRAQTKSIRERVYVKRARSIGATNSRILLRHIVPQTAPLIVANGVLAIAVAVFLETAISFLGLGDPATISLGKLIENAFDASAAIRGLWWMLIPPGVVVTLMILGCTLFGQALEDELNPRLKSTFLSTRSFRVRPAQGGEAE
ncbi:MAG: ABC transporter permease [Actinobacteria bacterium]|nr:ABC transporter permease [Actinomycetota bacterium]